MAALTPIFSGMTYDLLAQNQGLQWPCNDQAPLGSPILHQQTFPLQANGKARVIALESAEPAEMPVPNIL